jgi:hypothetical protein
MKGPEDIEPERWKGYWESLGCVCRITPYIPDDLNVSFLNSRMLRSLYDWEAFGSLEAE